jgi:hypothetical protein
MSGWGGNKKTTTQDPTNEFKRMRTNLRKQIQTNAKERMISTYWTDRLGSQEWTRPPITQEKGNQRGVGPPQRSR